MLMGRWVDVFQRGFDPDQGVRCADIHPYLLQVRKFLPLRHAAVQNKHLKELEIKS